VLLLTCAARNAFGHLKFATQDALLHAGVNVMPQEKMIVLTPAVLAISLRWRIETLNLETLNLAESHFC
jgi:hypothetical protein